MKSWDIHHWHRTFNKTQSYLRNRINGEDCDRDQIEQWRYFFRTHEPIIAMMVTQKGLKAGNAELCVEEVWFTLLIEIPKLNPYLTHEAFLFWLGQLIRVKALAIIEANASIFVPKPRATGDPGEEARYTVPQDADLDDSVAEYFGESLSDRVFQLSIVDGLRDDEVAKRLEITTEEVVARKRQLLQKLFHVLVKLDADASGSAAVYS